MSPPVVRFDGLRPPDARAFALDGYERAIVATDLADVPAALADAEAAVADGRWVGGWVAYEAASAFDPALEVVPADGTALADLPLVWLGVFRNGEPAAPPPVGDGYDLGSWSAHIDAAGHEAGVHAIRGLIADGETYQVNFTFPVTARFDGDPASLYRDLAMSQHAGFSAFLDTGRWVVASVSPELFFRWEAGRLTCRPMKGTVARGRDGTEDEEQREWLAGSEKNRAENLMIVDMIRNDLGRIARTGTVTVDRLFETERYDTVWQLTSTVSAEPRPGTRVPDVFAALFPSASVTGAPKVATMGIIARLEHEPRGIYCGAIGLGRPGREGGAEWSFNVAIRTALVDRRAGTVRYGTGGGVTFDSTAEDEYAEALVKTRVLGRRLAALRLFETMRWTPGEGARHLDHHLARLMASSAYFGIPLDPDLVRAAIERAVHDRIEPARLRVEVDTAGDVSAGLAELPSPPAGPIRLVIDDVPVDDHDPFLRHKTSRRDVYEEARLRHPEADDVVLINGRGEVTETTIANLAVLLQDRWTTPPIESGCLPGVERAVRLEAGELVEGTVTVDDLRRARAVARYNSLRGWEPCVVVGDPPS